MIKILTMLVGELDYDALFSSNHEGTSGSGSQNETGNSYKQTMQNRFASRVWYVNFVVFISIILMNLLVGLAVSDIQVNTYIHLIFFLLKSIKFRILNLKFYFNVPLIRVYERMRKFT